MKRAIAGFERRPFGASELAESVLYGLGGKIRVEPDKRVSQPLFQHDLAVAGTLRTRGIGSDVRAVGDAPADGLEPGEGGLLDF